jgi:hypothetical protein
MRVGQSMFFNSVLDEWGGDDFVRGGINFQGENFKSDLRWLYLATTAY